MCFNVRIADPGEEDAKEAFTRVDEVNKLSLFLSKCFAKRFVVLEFHRLLVALAHDDLSRT